MRHLKIMVMFVALTYSVVVSTVTNFHIQNKLLQVSRLLQQ